MGQINCAEYILIQNSFFNLTSTSAIILEILVMVVALELYHFFSDNANRFAIRQREHLHQSSYLDEKSKKRDAMDYIRSMLW